MNLLLCKADSNPLNVITVKELNFHITQRNGTQGSDVDIFFQKIKKIVLYILHTIYFF